MNTTLQDLTCRVCEKDFTPTAPNQVYCTPACRNIFHWGHPGSESRVCRKCHRKFPIKGNWRYCTDCRGDGQPKPVGPRSCKTCGTPIEKPTTNQKYCGIDCRPVRTTDYRAFKKAECERCGFDARHPVQLDVHHLDGNFRNNELENLQTLCANCHRLDRVGLLAA